MLKCRGTSKGIFGALDYRVELQPWDEDDGEDEDEDEDEDMDEDMDEDENEDMDKKMDENYQTVKGAKCAKDDEDDQGDESMEVYERPNYVFIFDPPKRRNK